MTRSSPARIERLTADLRNRGFEVERSGGSVLARDGPTALAGVDAPLEAVRIPDGNPLTVVSAVVNAAHEGRIPVLVVDHHSHDSVCDLLSSPFALADQRAGLRRFHTVEDRIRLTDDTFACVSTSGELSWSEIADGAVDSPQLRLTVGDETVAVLDSVAGLACPGPSPAAFRHRYARGPDGQFRVYEGSDLVGRYSGVTAMRADGVRPVPLPLVPEHHVRANARLARAVLLATVEDGTVRYESPDDPDSSR